MAIFGISDLHLYFNNPEKEMSLFGNNWENHPSKIEKKWREKIKDDDLVLIPGDISWAMSFEEAKKDLEFIASLPGFKIILKGNHDYWWGSIKNINNYFKENNYKIFAIQYNYFEYKNYIITGIRGWEYRKKMTQKNQKHYDKELYRFDLAMNSIKDKKKEVIFITHYPPFTEENPNTPFMRKIEEYKRIKYIYFGHLHNVSNINCDFYNKIINGNSYKILSADLINFDPIKLLDE